LLSPVLAVTLGGCDGESSFDAPAMDAGPPSARYASECAQWAAKFCDFQASCTYDYAPWEQLDQCVQRMTLTCELVASDPDVSFDPARTAACPAPDSGDCTSPRGHMCLGPGRAPLGAACLSGDACQSGYCATYVNRDGTSAPCGYCAAIMPVCKGACTAMESCVLSDDGGEHCVVLADLDAGCTKASDCRSYFCKAGFCATPSASATGGPCGGDAGDLDFYCANGLDFCNSKGVCTAETFADYGEACLADNARIVCRGAASCDYTDNVCVPPADDGDFCDPSQALGCLPPAGCVGHVCRFPDPRFCSTR
jgi:hypothetical protein